MLKLKKNKNLFLYTILAILILSAVGGSFFIDRFVLSPESIPNPKYNKPDSDGSGSDEKNYSENDRFRNSVVRFVRETANNYFSGQAPEHPEELEIESDWQTNITLYSKGNRNEKE